MCRRTIEAYDRIAGEFARVHAAMPDALTEYGRRFPSLFGSEAWILSVWLGMGRDAEGEACQCASVDGGRVIERWFTRRRESELRAIPEWRTTVDGSRHWLHFLASARNAGGGIGEHD